MSDWRVWQKPSARKYRTGCRVEAGLERRIGFAPNEVKRGLVRIPTAGTLFEGCIFYGGFSEAAITEREEIMDKFEVLSLIGWSEAFEVIPEGIKLDSFPCPIIPAVTALNIVAMVISVDVEPYASVVVACDRSSIDIDGGL